jgi:predicted metal-dependent hydrolase
MIIRMTTLSRRQQRYDHRRRDLIQRTGDLTIATDLGVPRSTARGWLSAAPTAVVRLQVTSLTEPELRQEILKLRRRVEELAALLRLALGRREVLRDWYIAQAKEKILSRADQHARELGVEFRSARIVDNRYRWGSCTVGDRVNFNWRLIKAPMFVIDYVIVHELAHLIEPNHTPEFWSIVRARTPTMDKAKAWLKKHGQVLEEEI